jgi:ankyrin repeat protein
MASTEAVAQVLIEHGAPIRIADDNEELPIHAAARRGFRDIITLLMSQGVPLNNPNKFGLTPLSIACKNGHLELVKYLGKRGGILGAQDDGLAGACVVGAALETIEAYLSAGADINSTLY